MILLSRVAGICAEPTSMKSFPTIASRMFAGAEEKWPRTPSRDDCRFQGSTDLFDMAHVEHCNAIAEFESFFLIVRDEDRGHVHLLQQRADFATQVNARLRVERAERFVKQQHLGFVSECSGDRDALLLAAGKL